jgi:hypothetical protein
MELNYVPDCNYMNFINHTYVCMCMFNRNYIFGLNNLFSHTELLALFPWICIFAIAYIYFHGYKDRSTEARIHTRTHGTCVKFLGTLKFKF